MKPSPSDLRPLPGPDEPVTLGINPETLLTLRQMQAEFGNVVVMQQPSGRPAVLISDAGAVRRLLVKHHARYRKGPGFERVKLLLGNGLIVSDGDTWRRSRTMIQPAFSRQNVHRLIELMVDCANSRFDAWSDIATTGGELNITQETSDFALELILRAIFGPDYENMIVQSGHNPFAFLSKESARDLRVVMQVRDVRKLILEVISARRDSGSTDNYDFLSEYLTATDKRGEAFTDEELLDELITLIVAGYETSAGTLNWAWYLLAMNPAAEKALLSESREVLGDADQIDHAALSQMRYCQQYLDETLRLFPPVWLFTRRALEDDDLLSYGIMHGADIYLSPYMVHHDTEYWSDPEMFDPGRFGESGPYRKGERPYFPFSLGPRRCLGEYFSFLEMKVHLGLLVQKFSMSFDAGKEPALDLGINLRSNCDIFLRPRTRDTG